MTYPNRPEFLRNIKENISQHSYHVTVVQQHLVPRYAYTIGLSERYDLELIVAGCYIYSLDDILNIIKVAQASLPYETNDLSITVDNLGSFSLRTVHPTWLAPMLLGALDYYKRSTLKAIQIVPDYSHSTIDVPDLNTPWNPSTEPAWKWLKDEWDLPIPATSSATTNLAALFGYPVTEASRWESDEWELFAGPGPDVTPEDMRIVPLGTLLGADPSLSAVVRLQVGCSIWRESVNSKWKDWTASSGG
ncbi:MAG: DUF4262 domain-containing protein [Alphaproteobacteria bacterium]|nr:DUF4262 domain-containing protein [Alphaproteobacteria bacterium]